MPITRRHFLASSALLSLGACSSIRHEDTQTDNTLKTLYKDNFRIGSIVKASQLDSPEPQVLEILGREFNALTMENAMKWENLHPAPDSYRWHAVDQFLAFCRKQQHAAVGHVLVWHSQTPDWVFLDDRKQPLDRATLTQRMLNHIQTTADHCKGNIWAWDVVNEAVQDNGELRRSRWHEQIGEDYITQAFAGAHEADPNALLIYNDYNMHMPAKRETVVALIRQLRWRGIAIHGIGMQGHIGLDYPNLNEFEKSIIAFANEGLDVHISELDIDVLPNPYTGADVSTRLEYSLEKDPYRNGLPKDVERRQAARAEALFKILLRHQHQIARVSFWGLSDRDSWKNDFPIPGRTNHPLLYDRKLGGKAMLSRLKKLKSE